MRIALPANSLFVADSAQLRADRDDLFQRLTNTLAWRSGGRRYEMEFRVHTGPFLAPALAAGQLLEVARAGAMARELERRGVPGESVVIGARPGDPSEVVMTFYGRIEDRSRVDFEELAR